MNHEGVDTLDLHSVVLQKKVRKQVTKNLKVVCLPYTGRLMRRLHVLYGAVEIADNTYNIT